MSLVSVLSLCDVSTVVHSVSSELASVMIIAACLKCHNQADNTAHSNQSDILAQCTACERGNVLTFSTKKNSKLVEGKWFAINFFTHLHSQCSDYFMDESIDE